MVAQLRGFKMVGAWNVRITFFPDSGSLWYVHVVADGADVQGHYVQGALMVEG